MLNEQGGVIDDLIIYHLVKGAILPGRTTPPRSTRRAWMEQKLKLPAGAGIFFSDRSSMYSAVALQGPKALELRVTLGCGLARAEANEITGYS